MSHYDPNISQVPRVSSPYGPECRALFGNVPEGWVLCGADMAGMQLRMLAHFLTPLDKGRYAKVVSEGDVHEENRQAFGFHTRNRSKTGIYAFIYGAREAKLAEIQELDWRDFMREYPDSHVPKPKGNKWKRGGEIMAGMFRKIIGLKTLIGLVQAASRKGYINGLDGRRVPIRSTHSALNYTIANADAVCCKDWMVSVDEKLREHGLKWGYDNDYVVVLLNHDEMQIACKAEWRELVERTCRELAPIIGAKYGVRCPLKADFKVGRNWAETH
jgi:DNA polymerase I-like protein with 3'-5' exonuclease and polymerase domains